MAKRYDPILMMMVEDEATKVQDAVSGFLVMYSKEGNQVTRGIIVKAANSSEARKKFEARKPGFYVHGVEALSDQGVESMKRRGMSVLDAVKKNTTSVSLQGEALIKHLMEVYGWDRKSAEKYAKEHKEKGKDAMDATPHAVVVIANDILREMGYNNSTGKYDKIVHGVKQLLGQGYLEGEQLKSAVKQEVTRLLQKYNMTDAAPVKYIKGFKDASTVDKAIRAMDATDPFYSMEAEAASTVDRYADKIRSAKDEHDAEVNYRHAQQVIKLHEKNMERAMDDISKMYTSHKQIIKKMYFIIDNAVDAWRARNK